MCGIRLVESQGIGVALTIINLNSVEEQADIYLILF